MSLIFTCSLLGEDLVLACGNTSDVAEHLEFAVDRRWLRDAEMNDPQVCWRKLPSQI